MPLWHFHHPPGAWSAEDRKKLAGEVTALYTRFGLPPFYVVALFHPVEESSFLVGGEPAGNTVRVVVEHIARHSDDPEFRRRTCEAISGILDPYTRERGLSYEFHIDETPRDLWRIDGLAPPPTRSEAERLWFRENRPVPY
ncbi:hypothetical protein SLNWT_1466 [Streptomyces albus]|uniref:Tautomerase cis-CaaD-like domain-containing protein n=1 Tax=Streptomyces albus (strain ATCC 21838 / DSM 41398 / FERM P-419 / JCM 4703 / NBRC 107858) TaxID=1081613 RepID=A0A0B5EUW2_STRA4|nr:hypothetical protein SLNWT_1466 [Streptomyces albus]AOU76158.1 hypothetical protein SLNHY_1467 [Streptomyces albus]AYN31949.1 4-oxalocrotonate tautomerase [Streptomyces albus]